MTDSWAEALKDPKLRAVLVTDLMNLLRHEEAHKVLLKTNYWDSQRRLETLVVQLVLHVDRQSRVTQWRYLQGRLLGGGEERYLALRGSVQLELLYPAFTARLWEHFSPGNRTPSTWLLWDLELDTVRQFDQETDVRITHDWSVYLFEVFDNLRNDRRRTPVWELRI